MSSTSVSLAARVTLAVILVAEIMNTMDHSIVLNAVPTLRNDLGVDASAVPWLTAAYSLPLAVGLVTGGRLGDAYGRRRVFLTGAAVFTLASLFCGIAVSPQTLIVARVVQGIGAAVMLPQVLATIHVTFDGESRSRAFGLYGATLSIGSVLGPVLAGVLLNLDLFGWGWRSIFLVNLPVGLAVLVLGRMFIPESTSETPERLDVTGMVLSAVAVVLIVFPLTTGTEQGWPAWCFLMLAAGVVAVVVFVLQQRRRQDDAPTVVLSVFRDPGFSAGLGSQLLFGMLSGIFFITMTLFIQTGLGMSPLQTSVAFILLTVGELAGVTVVMRSAGRFGRHLPQVGTLLGVVAVAVFLVVVTRWDADLTMLLLAAPLLLFGASSGLVAGPLADLAMRDIAEEHAGSASGLFNTSIHLGMALGTALTGLVFFSVTGGATDAALNREAFTGVLWTVGAAFVVMGALMFLIPQRRVEGSAVSPAVVE